MKATALKTVKEDGEHPLEIIACINTLDRFQGATVCAQKARGIRLQGDVAFQLGTASETSVAATHQS